MVYYGEWRPKTGETGLNLGRLLNNVNKSFEFCECMTLNIENLGHRQGRYLLSPYKCKLVQKENALQNAKESGERYFNIY